MEGEKVRDPLAPCRLIQIPETAWQIEKEREEQWSKASDNETRAIVRLRLAIHFPTDSTIPLPVAAKPDHHHPAPIKHFDKFEQPVAGFSGYMKNASSAEFS